MLGSAACFTVMAVLIKFLANDQSVAVMIIYRGLAGLAAVLPFALLAGRSAFAMRRPGRVFLRSFYGAFGFYAGFYAFAHLPLAEAQAISFSRTLFITVLAIWLLNETVGPRRWAAILIGFVGILVMVRPLSFFGFGAATIEPTAAGLAVASAFFFALAIVTVRDLTADHTPMALVIWANILTSILALPTAALEAAFTQTPIVQIFAWPGWRDFSLLIAMGVAGVGAQSCFVRALSTGEASVMAVVDYVRLPLAVGAGLVVFNERPDVWGLLGAAIVIGATLYITLRERQIGKTKTGD